MKSFTACYGKLRTSHGSSFRVTADSIKDAFCAAKKKITEKGYDVDKLYNFFVIDDEESMKSFKKDCYLG